MVPRQLPAWGTSWRRALTLACPLVFAAVSHAQFPPGFSTVPVGSAWVQPTGLTFAADGRMFVWEKAGRVWLVENGVKSAQPVIDIREEVGDWSDHGLLAFALDPLFLQNGRVYAGYVVDYHYLVNFGTPAYDPTANQYFHDTIARITRFTLDVQSPALTLVPGSRRILVGESMTTGIPICFQSHGMGTLVFGEDGTLLVSVGESASFNTVDRGGPVPGSSNTALADGIIRAAEDVGAFRAQLVDSLSGKILRIDPNNGDGVASNPWFDPTAPRAARSRVWGLGLRNPFRMSLQPGTGAHDPALGQPGTLWIGDVGWNAWEELDVCDGPALDFGWPLYEGLEAHAQYTAQCPFDLDAPNPLFGVGACTQAWFKFSDLLVQDALSVPSWRNPCDTAQQVPASLPRFVHKRPLVDWFHGLGPSRTGTFQGAQAATIALDAPGSPIVGQSFGGHCSIGGAWFSGAGFPPEYQGSYYMVDYVASWIQRMEFDPLGVPIRIESFARGPQSGTIVDLAADPASGGLYFAAYEASSGLAEVRRIIYSTNLPPVAVATASSYYGPAPLGVQFTGSGSTDPEMQPLTYEWDFGDGSTSAVEDPTHIYYATSDITAQGTIIARMFELTPPHPLGSGNQDPEIIRDGDMPPLGTQDAQRQYDTFHAGDQGSLDWIGYSFPTTRVFHALVFQEGVHHPDGGWFDQLRVQVGDGTHWSLVPSSVATPSYGNANGADFGTYRLEFAPAVGTQIRVVGVPGGSGGYISVGELRVIADDPALANQPIERDVRLTVRDPVGGMASTTLIVSLNNTPPVVHITSPIDGSTYPLTSTITPTLTANVTDLEHGPAQLTCAWQTTLHHDDHIHPEPIDPACTTSTVITPVGCDGPTYFYEVALKVTDAAGLSGEDHVYLYPDCMPDVVCAGDGSGTACPCGNNGATGRGCENSFGTGGGRLDAVGVARLSNDTLLLSASSLPPSTTALFFQGTTIVGGGSGVVFGDGLRCCGGTVVRLGLHSTVNGACSVGAPAGDDPLSLSTGLTGEGARYYQAWYRNQASFCTGSLYNLTNALRVTWIP